MSSTDDAPPASGKDRGPSSTGQGPASAPLPDALHSLAARPGRLLHDWRTAYRRCVEYLGHLGFEAEAGPEAGSGEVAELANQAILRAVARDQWEAGGDACSEAFRALRELVLERDPTSGTTAAPATDEFTAWRAVRTAGGAAGPGPETAARILGGSMPPILRGSIPRARLERHFVRPRTRRLAADERAMADRESHARQDRDHDNVRNRRREMPWTVRAARRRRVLGTLVVLPSLLASLVMMQILPERGGNLTEVLITVFFGALFGWISIGFWTALFGFYTLVRREERFRITHLAPGEEFAPIDPSTRTAVVMPICEEPVERVFAGLRAIQQSLDRTGSGRHFDFFVLSDSADPATGIREEEAWLQWCRDSDGFGRIFYRRRRIRLRRKSGNVADFCRRWGRRYRYMVMLDADSVMSGASLERLVQLMEKHPTAGMIQTVPTAVFRRSIYGRVQQFAGRTYGPMFTAGLHYWQLGDGQYWGHNTIIRIAPFMAHCGLPLLPGKPPLGGEILSHDFVEAALMGRAGWSLWLAFDLSGSYEEIPSSMLEEMKRDRRWCQGNLQHVRLLLTKGLFGAHRALFLNGALSYVSALLWFCFLLLSTAEAIRYAVTGPDYFPDVRTLFPQWPVWRPDRALGLLGATAVVLFLPKVLSVVLIFKRGQASLFGGAGRLLVSVPLEILLSSLFAPIRMVFHSRFVVTNLMGRTVEWKSQPREDAETTWREAFDHHAGDTVLATLWAMLLYRLSPDYFWWILPVVGALVVSIPVSVLVSRVGLGDRVRRLGVFTIPEEVDPPREIEDLERNLAAGGLGRQGDPSPWGDPFVKVVADPRLNAVHRTLLGRRRRWSRAIREARRAVLEKVVAAGPGAADQRDRRILLNDPQLLDEIHTRVWCCEDDVAEQWGIVG